jgi:hypothetical protein
MQNVVGSRAMSTANSFNSYNYSKILIAARLGSVGSSAAIKHFSTEKALLGAQLPWAPFLLTHLPSLLQAQYIEVGH